MLQNPYANQNQIVGPMPYGRGHASSSPKEAKYRLLHRCASSNYKNNYFFILSRLSVGLRGEPEERVLAIWYLFACFKFKFIN